MISEEYKKSIKKCRKCRYASIEGAYLVLCMYWEIEDRLRPCKGGTECTVFKKRSKSKRVVPIEI